MVAWVRASLPGSVTEVTADLEVATAGVTTEVVASARVVVVGSEGALGSMLDGG